MSTVDTRIGTVLAGYRIESLLGRGGMSSVYLAEHLRLHRKVALKLLAPDLAHDERFRDRFLRESQLAASLDHPNIVPIYDADEADGVLYIAMRWVDGTDLRELLRRYSPLDPRRAVAIVGQAAAGLDAAHRRGLVHRDVKPGNILIGEDDHVYVSDFGLTKQASSQSGLTATGQLVGTVDYVAPEQIQGQPVDGRTDVYSLTCVLYEALVGAKPFDRDTEVATIWAHIQDPPPAPSAVRPELPTGLDAVTAKGMAKRPDDRYATCRELVDAARQELGVSSGEIPMPATARRRANRRSVIIAAAAVGAIGAAAVALLATHGGTGKLLTPVPSNSVAVIDPAKNRVSAVVPVASTPSPASAGIAAGLHAIWLVNNRDGTVSRIEVPSNTVQTFGAGSTPAGVAAGPTTWISGDGSGLLTPLGPGAWVGPVRLGPSGTARQRRTDLQAITQGRGSIWVLDAGRKSGLVRVTGTNRITRSPGFTGATDITYAAGAIWVVDNSVGQVARIDPRTMVVVKRIDVPDGPLRIAEGGGALWVASPGDPGPGRVWRIDPVMNVATASTVVGHDATGVAFGDGSVWVVHSVAGTVQRLDGRTLRSVKTVAVGNHPTAIAFGGGRLYVAVSNADPFGEFEGGGPGLG